jgi:hypothetical protein
MQKQNEPRDHRRDRAGESDRSDRGDRGGEPLVQTRVFVAGTGLGVGVRGVVGQTYIHTEIERGRGRCLLICGV